jgi:hypothetical protein
MRKGRRVSRGPATVPAVEIYPPERKAEFLRAYATDSVDRRKAAEHARELSPAPRRARQRKNR